MSNARKGTGVANVVRQTWDLGHYEKLAQLRADGQLPTKEEKKVINSSKEEFKAANQGAAGPAGSSGAFLKARTSKISLETSVGTVKVVKSDDESKSGGYYCQVCETSLKDSVAYLDHINGKRHLRRLGYSMRVERSSVDEVKTKLQMAAKRKWEPLMLKKLNAMEEYNKKLEAVKNQEAQLKRQKREKKKANQGKVSSVTKEESESAQDDQSTPDTDLMAMMGFGNFGGSKKS